MTLRDERGLMTRKELVELDAGRVLQELGLVGDWLIDIAVRMQALAPAVEEYNALYKEASVAGDYKSVLQSVARVQRDALI